MIKISNVPATPRSKYRVKGGNYSYSTGSSSSGYAAGIVSKLSELTDVSIQNVSEGNTITWDEALSTWKNHQLTKSDIGLSNVDNLSRAQILDEMTVTGRQYINNAEYFYFSAPYGEFSGDISHYGTDNFENIDVYGNFKANNASITNLTGDKANLGNDIFIVDNEYESIDAKGFIFRNSESEYDYELVGNINGTNAIKDIDYIDCQDLNVRGNLNVYELTANKVRSTNGYLYVTDSDTVTEIVASDLILRVKFKEGNFRIGDIILTQYRDGNNWVSSQYRITAELGGVYSLIGLNANSQDIKVNDYFVRVDSASDDDRKSGILLSPYDGSYIDFYKGNGSGSSNTVTTSIGDLSHLNKPGVEGYGLYSDNAHLTGTINAKNSNIEGNVILDTMIARDNNNKMLSSVNLNGLGEYIQYRNDENNTKLMEFSGGNITYYNADGSVKWVLGEAGTIQTLVEYWTNSYWFKTDLNFSNVLYSTMVKGTKYKEFEATIGSINQSYIGLTVLSTVSDSTKPGDVNPSHYIPDGYYIKNGMAMMDMSGGTSRFFRRVYTFLNGKVIDEVDVYYK